MNGLDSVIDTSGYTGERGIYAEARLHPEYGIQLQGIADRLLLDKLDLDDLHCTLIYSREKAPQRVPLIKGFMRGLVTGVQYWKGHNDKMYVVADVHGTPFIDAHARLCRVGAEHSFVGFKPHVTLASMEQLPEDFDAKLETVNRDLQANPIPVIFHKVSARDIKPD